MVKRPKTDHEVYAHIVQKMHKSWNAQKGVLLTPKEVSVLAQWMEEAYD